MRDALGNVDSVLLLGGTSEIGLAVARALVVARGARTVILAGRDPDGLAAAAARLRDAGAETVDTVRFDATDQAAVHEQLVDDLWTSHGDVDVTVAAFGVLGDQVRAEHDTTHALDVAHVNYLGAVSVLTPLANLLERQGHGALVVLSSVAGERPRRANYLYGSTKAGLDALAQGLSDRLRHAGVQVLVVRPGFVHTRMTAGMDPAPLSTTAPEVARQVLRGLDGRAHTIHLPPALRWVMTVLRHLPRPLFRLLPR